MAGYGAEYQHESVSFSQHLLANTKELKVIAAILPGPWYAVFHPAHNRAASDPAIVDKESYVGC